MQPMLVHRSSNLHLALTIALAFSAAGGWGMYALTAGSTAEVEKELREQIATFERKREELVTERNQARAELLTLVQQRDAAISARNEMTRLYNEARAEQAVVRSQSDPGAQASRQPQDQASRSDAAEPDSAGSAQEVVLAAQQTLTRLGHGRLVADGILGPGTRAAIEELQRARGLTVTGELDPETLAELRLSGGMAAVQ